LNTRLLGLLCLFVAGGMAAPSAQQPASVDHVRTALDKPPSLLEQARRKADFTVHIEERRPLQEIFDTPPWATDPVGWQPPAVGFDLLGLVRYLGKSAADAKREHDVRAAREDVRQAIADYCAAQPNSARMEICSAGPAFR
jgi:hypothetical protein